jgi:cell division protein FtsI/penicillin-binding protein 2
MRAATVVCGIVALLLGGGAARLAYIERTQGDEWRRKAARQQTAQRTIPALRGAILDTRGRVLAGTIRRPAVFADPSDLPDPGFAACSVAPILGMKPAELEGLLRNPTHPQFVRVKRGVRDDELPIFEKLIRDRNLRGFGVEYEVVRVYPQGRVAPHVIGFAGTSVRNPGTPDAHEDLRGLAGIEETYDTLLSGTPGRRSAVVDAGRRRVRGEEFVPAVDGCTLVLTIDAFIQDVAQAKLREAVDKYGAEWGSAVVIDPQTGEVLAMANMPDFDPAVPLPADFGHLTERQKEEAKNSWRNRAIADAFEPGSVFKPFIASCALDEGVTRIDEVFSINGPVHDFGRRTIRDTHPYGALALHEVISKSSNIGMGLLGARCGMERLYRYVRLFGFGDPTGIGLSGEHTGLVQDFANWNPSFSPQSVPIGQEIAVTPIQIVTAFSVFCNGGVLLRPRIIRGVIGPDGETLADYSRPIAVRRVLDEQMAEVFRLQALVETVRDGTGKLAKLDDWQVFGKTGTAQVAVLKGQGKGYASGKYVGSFVGGAPASRPRAVCLCSLYKPSKAGYYGGVIAAPVVKEILGETLAYMQVPAELTEPAGKPGPGTRKTGRADVRDQKPAADPGGVGGD